MTVQTSAIHSLIQAIAVIKLSLCLAVVASILMFESTYVQTERSTGPPTLSIIMATYQGVLLLFSGQEHGCCLQHGPPQPPLVFSMLASQTSPPRKQWLEAEHIGVNSMKIVFHTLWHGKCSRANGLIVV